MIQNEQKKCNDDIKVVIAHYTYWVENTHDSRTIIGLGAALFAAGPKRLWLAHHRL
jgi:hypothetical protein